MHRIAVVLAYLGCLVLPLCGQYPVSFENRQERILAVVPMVGAGTYSDPKRPLFAPRPEDLQKSGIQSFSYQLSDDGQLAIVEFVAPDRSALQAILRDPRVRKVFEKGKHTRNEIEAELRKFKREFTLTPGRGAQKNEGGK